MASCFWLSLENLGLFYWLGDWAIKMLKALNNITVAMQKLHSELDEYSDVQASSSRMKL